MVFAALSAFMWWKSATVPDGTTYDLGEEKEDPYISYYNNLKWWQKQFSSIRYPENQFFVNDIVKDFNRYAATYACIATIISIIDFIISCKTI